LRHRDVIDETYEIIDFMNLFNNKEGLLNHSNKEKFAQYYTPENIAIYMASMFKAPKKRIIRIIDPGCGFGILTVAFLQRLLQIEHVKVKKAIVTLYEIDIHAIQRLKNIMELVSFKCMEKGLEVIYTINNDNFITSFSSIKDINESHKYDYVIVNPPYMKLPVESDDNIKLEKLNIKVPNYYAAFVSLAQKMLINKGELVAITPRSFCNGAYFLNFRQDFFKKMVFDKIHLFESRTDLFKEDDVLQENIIFHCIKKEPKNSDKINVIHSYNDSLDDVVIKKRRLEDIIFPNDDNLIIRILKDDEDKEISKKINALPCKLSDLNIEVSTGPVVDFRERKETLSKEKFENSIPLFCSAHLTMGGIKWPKQDVKKYNFIINDEINKSKMRKNGNYVLVKRMTSKEEKRRITSAVCGGRNYDYDYFAFDNKVNYYHRNKEGLPLVIAKGLNIFLNSTIVDRYFRTFSGNTQVNVTDLKSLNYPSEFQLHKLGEKYENIYIHQNLIDKEIEKILFS
jgi:adenine-specific DNA-methyltransferase